MKRVLAIETSCDDTSVAIVENSGWVEAVCSAHQDLVHAPFGGVVPELASRQHTLHLLPLVEKALEKAGHPWSDIHGLVVTTRPGLIGSLMAGVVTAKTLAWAKNLPFLGVNHIEGHILSPLLRDEDYAPPQNFAFPYLALVVSGGHSHIFLAQKLGQYKLLGQTVDDAAGEAFDKFAKIMGLGYPGGVKVDERAKEGDRFKFEFPRPMIHEDRLLLSFSGLKTAALRFVEGWSEEQKLQHRDSLCASYQEAIVEVLLSKLERAAQKTGLSNVVITGGVSANSRLRELALKQAAKHRWTLALPPLKYCTDNAAMIGLVGLWRMNQGERSSQDLGPSAASLPGDFVSGLLS